MCGKVIQFRWTMIVCGGSISLHGINKTLVADIVSRLVFRAGSAKVGDDTSVWVLDWTDFFIPWIPCTSRRVLIHDVHDVEALPQYYEAVWTFPCETHS